MHHASCKRKAKRKEALGHAVAERTKAARRFDAIVMKTCSCEDGTTTSLSLCVSQDKTRHSPEARCDAVTAKASSHFTGQPLYVYHHINYETSVNVPND